MIQDSFFCNLATCVQGHFYTYNKLFQPHKSQVVAVVTNRDATIQNRSDTENSDDRPIPIQSDTSAGFFFFCINVDFLYCSVFA